MKENFFKFIIIFIVLISFYLLFNALFEQQQSNTSKQNLNEQSFYSLKDLNYDKKKICEILLKDSKSAAVTNINPPKSIPQELYNEFTLGGKIPVSNYYINEAVNYKKLERYSKNQIDKMIEKAKRKETYYYG